MDNQPKFIQIMVDGNKNLLALDEIGQVWKYWEEMWDGKRKRQSGGWEKYDMARETNGQPA